MKNKPLTIGIKDGEIQISIGISTLAFASKSNNEARIVDVTDEQMFAEDVLKQLQSEGEIGETIVTDAINEAIARAVESGSFAVKCEGEEN